MPRRPARLGVLAALALTATAGAEPWHAGEAALPGADHVAAAGSLERGFALLLRAGYGYLGEVLGAGDHHQRGALDLAGSYRPRSWLALAARFTGRYDRHSAATGDDSGFVGDPRFYARASRRLGDDLDLAGQLTIWLPGGDAPSIVPSATTLTSVAALSWTPAGRGLRLSANAGFRLDRSARSIASPERLSPADRLSLGVSDSNAILVGLAGEATLGPVQGFGEWSWDLLLGGRAPPLRQSPMRLAAGARLPLDDMLTAEAIVETSLASKPVDMSRLFPVEPRVTVLLGLAVRLPSGAPVIAPRPEHHEAHHVVALPGPPKPAGLVVRATANGGPLAGATVTVTVAGHGHDAISGDDGVARFADLPPGAATIAVGLTGYHPGSGSARLVRGNAAEVAISLEPELPPGQLRGVVRSSHGRALPGAKLSIAPLGTTIACDAHGAFQVDLPPGDYDVTIHVDKFQDQTRHITIQQDGVTILNPELRR